MQKIQNYIRGQWTAGQGVEYVAHNAITGEEFAEVSSAGLDYAAILEYGRSVGGPALRNMTFQQRGLMLKALALHLVGLEEEILRTELGDRCHQTG
jgi:oxepin-CoA hydrolase/3-oxo-5,6-dehydrosuberyl-CoA semialdehyde dehydrogenase